MEDVAVAIGMLESEGDKEKVMPMTTEKFMLKLQARPTTLGKLMLKLRLGPRVTFETSLVRLDFPQTMPRQTFLIRLMQRMMYLCQGPGPRIRTLLE
jgi:hypothetical protein